MRLVVLTAACGVGKSTLKDAILERGLLPGFACIDTDEVGINWWDYGMEKKDAFNDDFLAEAVRRAEGRDLLFSTCLNPMDFYANIRLQEKITSTVFIALTCSDEAVARRLKARPAERMCGDEAFIQSQIEYLNWYRKNRGKFQLYVDNTGMTVHETAEKIAGFIRAWP